MKKIFITAIAIVGLTSGCIVYYTQPADDLIQKYIKELKSGKDGKQYYCDKSAQRFTGVKDVQILESTVQKEGTDVKVRIYFNTKKPEEWIFAVEKKSNSGDTNSIASVCIQSVAKNLGFTYP